MKPFACTCECIKQILKLTLFSNRSVNNLVNIRCGQFSSLWYPSDAFKWKASKFCVEVFSHLFSLWDIEKKTFCVLPNDRLTTLCLCGAIDEVGMFSNSSIFTL